jgi:hypothetical protein
MNGEKISVSGVINYDEFASLYSKNECKGKNSEPVISLSVDFSNKNLTNILYRTRDLSSIKKVGFEVKIIGVLERSLPENGSYKYIKVEKYEIIDHKYIEINSSFYSNSLPTSGK